MGEGIGVYLVLKKAQKNKNVIHLYFWSLKIAYVELLVVFL